jgi:hypothetical protein
MMSHLLENNLLKQSQHGFMPRKSCCTNLLECFWTFRIWIRRYLYDVNVPLKSIKLKNFENYFILFIGILKVTEEKSRIRSRIRNRI